MIIANIIVLLLVLAIVAPTAQSQESKPTVRHHRVEETEPQDPIAAQLDQAETAMQNNDFAAAETSLQKIIAAKPDNFRAWFDLGYVYNATHRRDQAVDAYRKSVSLNPNVFESNLNLGLLLAQQGVRTEAAKYLKAATQLKPTTHPEESLARAWLALGRVLQPTDPQQALAAYGLAAKLNDKDPAPHLVAGDLLLDQKDFDAAAREFQAAAVIDPKSPDALAGLANVYIARKKFADAEAALNKALLADPANDTARAQLARVLAAEGKTDAAAAELKKSLQAGANPQAELELGVLYGKAGNDTEAEHWLREAAAGFDGILKVYRQRQTPPDSSAIANSAEAHYQLGSLLLHEKKFPEAQQELLLAVKLRPEFGDAYGNLAVAAASNKNYQLALQALDARAKYLPDIPATYFLRAATFDNLKAVPQAVEYYQKFLATADGKFPDQEWQARHRLIALDPQHADKYRVKK